MSRWPALVLVGLVLSTGGSRAWGSDVPVPPRSSVPDDIGLIAVYAYPSSVEVGELVQLHVRPAGVPLRLDVLRAGTLPLAATGLGRPVGRAARIGPRARLVRVPTVALRTGLYFARLRAGTRLGYAPFVVRPRHLGEHRVAVVVPDLTWQAYNFSDEDHDGVGDSWYVDARRASVRLDRAFLDHGIPPHYAAYDRGFMRWLTVSHHEPDVLAQEDVEAAGGPALRRAYDLIVFPGHHEYVTTAEYDAVATYRRLGGSLAFLSANNLFYRVRRTGATLTRTGRWRDLGRPEAAIIGVQYVDWYQGRWPNRPFTIVGARRVPWIFSGTGLGDGDSIGKLGIEIDARAPAGPAGTIVLAHAPGIFGPGTVAEMTFHRTPAGARVFAAGGFTLGGQAMWPGVRQMLDNLWHGLPHARVVTARG